MKPANKDHLELSTHIQNSVLRVKAGAIREAIEHVQRALDQGADPCEAVVLMEDYANSIDPDVPSTVTSISAAIR